MPAQFLLDEGILDTDLLGTVIIVSANADLGGISSSGSSLVTHLVTMGAELGGLSANANTAPDTPGGDEGGTTHGFVQPYFPPVIPPQEIKISTIYAVWWRTLISTPSDRSSVYLRKNFLRTLRSRVWRVNSDMFLIAVDFKHSCKAR